MLNLLDSWFKMPFGDAAFYALFGFLFVFAGIVILILIFTLLGMLMKKIGNRPKKPKKEKKSKATANEAKPSENEQSDPEISPELVAVLTAAVAACLENENSACDFVVRRIKKL